MLSTLKNITSSAATFVASPSSSPSLGAEGELKLVPEALTYVLDSFESEDDPFFVIHWLADGVMDALNEAAADQIPNLPPPTLFLNTASPE